MASKAKPALSVWLADKRRERGASVADIARLLDRSEVTIRGWEAGQPPSVDHPAIAVLESYYGSEAPRDEVSGFAELAALVTELREQNRLAEERTEVMAAAMREQTAMMQAVLEAITGVTLPDAEERPYISPGDSSVLRAEALRRQELAQRSRQERQGQEVGG